MSGPLTGLTVVDVTSAAAGPFAAALLGQLGAEVIKIEPPTGDRIHVVLPTQQGRSTTYMAMNVNKRGMILNLKNPQEYAIALGSSTPAISSSKTIDVELPSGWGSTMPHCQHAIRA
jgi:CoA:oxalate CoA-transferase